MTRRFTRTPEDFTCLECGTAVRGDGYTNHCPSCLWSRHVDVFPGDRAAGCGGPMRPVAVESRAHDIVITQVCERCGHQRRNRSAPADDPEALRRVAAEAARAATAPGAAAPRGRPRPIRDRARGSGARRPPG